MQKHILLIIFLLFINIDLTAQETTFDTKPLDEIPRNIWYNTLGFNFKIQALSEEEITDNALFQQLVKLNAPFSDISLPVIGEFHFRNYDFVDSESGPFKYNYFLGTANLIPSLFLFGSESHKANIKFSLGANVRVWNKRRKPLRSVYEWEASNAVKTPSYKPGIYYSRLLGVRKKSSHTNLRYLELGFTHHSNGQDAPTLASQDSTLLLSPAQKYNINDGDFSTNYITIGYHNVKKHLKKHIFHSIYLVLDGIGTHRVEHEDLLKYKLNYSFKYMVYDDEEAAKDTQMGSHNFEFNFGFGLVDFNQFNLRQSINYSLSYRYQLPWTRKIAFLFAYGYMGQDDYNIFLQNNMHYFRWGLSSLII